MFPFLMVTFGQNLPDLGMYVLHYRWREENADQL